jgi:hypothetical protein
MSARPPELPPDRPLVERDDALGGLMRRANAEFARDIDAHAALRRLEARREQPKSRFFSLGGLALAPALLACAWLAWLVLEPNRAAAPTVAMHTPEAPVQAPEVEQSLALGPTKLPDGSSVETSRESRARWRRTARGIRVRLAAGEVRCAVTKQQGEKRFVVEAGGYAFVVLGTELRVQRSAEQSRLEVLSGRVEVRRGDASLAFVGAGQSWSGPTLSEATPAPTPQPSATAEPSVAPRPVHDRSAKPPKSEPAPPGEDCAARVKEQDFAQAERCYAQQAQGSGLSAELALYELSRLRLSALGNAAGAVSALEEHRQRFARGVLTSQVELSLVRALSAAGRHAEAVRALEPLIARGGPKQAELTALKAELETKLR